MSKKYTAPATVSFNGQSLITTKDGDEEILVAMKPIVEAMGIQWEAQFKLIKRDAVLNSTISIMEIVGKDGKTRQMTCLPIQYLNGWLFKINAARYKDPIRRELIIKYQKECYQALHDYWHKGEAVNPRSTTHPKPKLKRPQIPPVNKNLLFKYSYDGLTQIKTTHEELETIQKYLSEPEIELICILRSLGSQRRSQTYKLAYRLYKIMHKVRIQMGHRPDLSEREAINYVVDRSLGMA